MHVVPLRRIMSGVMTNTAAGDRPTVLSCRDTEVTAVSRRGNDDVLPRKLFEIQIQTGLPLAPSSEGGSGAATTGPWSAA